MTAALVAAAALLASCHAVDGDTLRCGDERIRLLGIDAPEKPGHCRPGRKCASGDPEASTASLAEAMAQGPIAIERRGKDRYGRTLASVTAGGIDIACWQLQRGAAIYRPDWDSDGALGRRCKAARTPPAG